MLMHHDLWQKGNRLIKFLLVTLLLTACGGGTDMGTDPNAGDLANQPVVTTPTASAPTNPVASNPSPTDPVVTDPVPTDPAPTDPVVTDPVPTDPAPTDPVVTDPVPTDPTPTDPAVTDPVPTEPPPTDPVPPPAPDTTFSTSSTSQFINQVCVSWDFDLAAQPEVVGFRIYDAQGAIICSTENLQFLHVDCAYDATLPASTFTMTAYDINGNESAHSAPFPGNKAPVAEMSVNGTNTLVQFDASSSHDSSGGSIVSYSWNFGDGSSATGVSASHDYQPGVYTVSLEVVDNGGASTSTEATITIS